MQHLKTHPANAKSKGAERRGEPRQVCGGSISILPFDSAGGFTEAEIINFSVHGICVAISEPLKTGTEFIVKARLDRPTLMIYLARNCAQDGRRYRVGAEFVGAVCAPNENGEDAHAKFIEQLEARAAAHAEI